MIPRPPPGPELWLPPRGPDASAVAAGQHWDALRLVHDLANPVLAVLGDRSGAVIDAGDWCYFLLPVRMLRTEPDNPRVRVLSTGDFITVPPRHRQHGPGLHWRVPLSRSRYLTHSSLLRIALNAAGWER